MIADGLDVYAEEGNRVAGSPDYVLGLALRALDAARIPWRVLVGADPARSGPAAFVHVDLSVVPSRLVPPAGAYGACVNREATDIRRTRYSTARLDRSAAWRGPVIVKTVLNHRGVPEINHRIRSDAVYRWRRRLLRLLGRDPRRRANVPYPLYPSIDAVPERVWDDPDRLVERFLPGALTTPVVKHRYDFFLDVAIGTRSVFDSLHCDPRAVRDVSTFADVPEPVARVRRDLRLESGGIDFFVVDGEAVVVDANKTTTTSEAWMSAYPAVGRHVREVGERLVALARGDPAVARARAAAAAPRAPA